MSNERRIWKEGMSAKEFYETPEYQERLRQFEETCARNVAEYKELEQSILEELAAVGMDVPSIGISKNLADFMPFSHEVTSVFLRRLPDAHPRIQDTLVPLLAAARPFDGRPLIELFDRSPNEQLRWQIGNTIACIL